METEKNSGASSENRGYDLKPCPFCGGHALMMKLFHGDGYACSCELCNAMPAPWGVSSPKKAAEIWNTRKRPYESRRKLPCPKCGTPRPETWFTGGMWEDKKVGITCRECGFGVWDTSEIQAIRRWNSEKRGMDG